VTGQRVTKTAGVTNVFKGFAAGDERKIRPGLTLGYNEKATALRWRAKGTARVANGRQRATESSTPQTSGDDKIRTYSGSAEQLQRVCRTVSPQIAAERRD
jgi:hypothetical protein